MTTKDTTFQAQTSGLAKVWQRMPVLVKAFLMIFFVGLIGANVMPIFYEALKPPISLIVISAYLFLYWKFFSGSWGPKKTAEIRKKYFRAGSLSPKLWKWSLLLAILFVLVFQSSLVVIFRLFQFPADLFNQGFGFEALPLWTAWAIIILAALSAALTEEVGFRKKLAFADMRKLPWKNTTGHFRQSSSSPLCSFCFILIKHGLCRRCCSSLLPAYSPARLLTPPVLYSRALSPTLSLILSTFHIGGQI